MGDRQDNLEKGLGFLAERLRMGKRSSMYDTEPVGNTAQPHFLNLVCQVYTTLTPMGLLATAKGIEAKMGRAPASSGAPRPIDIDILFYGDQVVESTELIIPHPRLGERAFILIPLLEIAPDLVHPVNGKTIGELLKRVTGKEGVLKMKN